nr:glycerate kinase II [Klebsiella pneumoniae]
MTAAPGWRRRWGETADRRGPANCLRGGALETLARIDLSELDSRLADCRIDVACDVTNPLTGPQGASAVFGPQKGRRRR